MQIALPVALPAVSGVQDNNRRAIFGKGGESVDIMG
jgi:hypothetical protein